MSCINTSAGVAVNTDDVASYIDSLVGRFFKILPMRESNDKTCVVYMRGLQRELLGCGSLFSRLKLCTRILSLSCVLENLIVNWDVPLEDVRRDVFNSITNCKNIADAIRKNAEVDR